MRLIMRTSRHTGVSVGPIGALWLLLLYPIELVIRFYAWGIVQMFRLMILAGVWLYCYAATQHYDRTHGYRGRHAR